MAKYSSKGGPISGTSTSSSDGGVPASGVGSLLGVPQGGGGGGGGGGAGLNGAGSVLVPQIGGRNRSLPNLSKQNSGPNSARSNKGDK